MPTDKGRVLGRVGEGGRARLGGWRVVRGPAAAGAGLAQDLRLWPLGCVCGP